MSTKVEWSWILLLSHKEAPMPLSKQNVVCSYLMSLLICFIKSHEDTSKFPEWSDPQPRGLDKSMVWIMGFLVENNCHWFGELLSKPVFSLICSSNAVRSLQRAVSITPCWLLRAHFKREACEILRVGHKGRNVRGGHWEDVTTGWPTRWTWAPSAPPSLWNVYFSCLLCSQKLPHNTVLR